MSQFVEIPVVDRKRPLVARIFGFAIWSILVVFILLVIFIDDPNNQLGRIFIGVLVIYVIGAVIGVFFVKEPYKIIGNLVLEDAAIIFVNNHTSKEVYPISKITDIQLQYQGYHGRIRLFPITFDSGLGNIISFKYSDIKYEYELFLEHKHIQLLMRQLENWEKITA